MRLAGVVAGIALSFSVGCARTGRLEDQFRKSDYRLPFDQRLRFEGAAPVIVLGDVVEVNEVGPPRRSSGDSRIGIHLTRIKIDIEEVIKGDVRSGQMEFYYFVYSSAASEVDLGVPRYLPSVGQRRIYFLKPANGGYRSVGDVTDYTLRVSSGTHKRGFCQGKSAGCCIAEILLVPQPDFNATWFETFHGEAEAAAGVLCDRR